MTSPTKINEDSVSGAGGSLYLRPTISGQSIYSRDAQSVTEEPDINAS